LTNFAKFLREKFINFFKITKVGKKKKKPSMQDELSEISIAKIQAKIVSQILGRCETLFPPPPTQWEC
jgi:hypothetical protein